jgi:hypothetical protein
MERDSMIIYRSFYEAIKELPMQTQAEVWNAIYELGLNGNLVQLTGMAKTIFTLINPQIEANYKKYMNGKRPKLKQSESKTEAKHKQNGSKTEANVNVNVNVKDIYRSFAHLSISEDEVKKLLDKHTITQINNVLNDIENYKQNTKYKSLYLTAVKWLQKNEPTSEGISPEEIKARKYGYIN